MKGYIILIFTHLKEGQETKDPRQQHGDFRLGLLLVKTREEILLTYPLVAGHPFKAPLWHTIYGWADEISTGT